MIRGMDKPDFSKPAQNTPLVQALEVSWRTLTSAQKTLNLLRKWLKDSEDDGFDQEFWDTVLGLSAALADETDESMRALIVAAVESGVLSKRAVGRASKLSGTHVGEIYDKWQP